MIERDSSPTPASLQEGSGRLWAAAVCIGLSHLLGALWLWSLIWSGPLR